MGGCASTQATVAQAPVTDEADKPNVDPKKAGTQPQGPNPVRIQSSTIKDPLAQPFSPSKAKGVEVSTGSKVDLNLRANSKLGTNPFVWTDLPGEVLGLVESCPLPWCLVDNQGIIRRTNELFRMQVGGGNDIFDGTNLHEFVFESFRVQTKKRFTSLAKLKKDFKLQTVLKSRMPEIDLSMETEAVRKLLQETMKSHVNLKVDLLFIPVNSQGRIMWICSIITVSLLQDLRAADNDSLFAAKTDEAVIAIKQAAASAAAAAPAAAPGGEGQSRGAGEASTSAKPADGNGPTLATRLNDAIATNEMQEATQKSRARRERRRSSMIAEPFDQRCKKWFINMQTALALPPDGEVALTAKLWAGISLQNSVDPSSVSLGNGQQYQGAPGARPMVNKPMRRGSL